MSTPVCTVNITAETFKTIEILNVDGLPFSKEFMESLKEQLWEDHHIALCNVTKIEVTDYWVA